METTEKADYQQLPERLIADPGPDSILGPGHDYDSVTKRIAGIVYLPLKNSPKKWLVGAFIAFCFVNLLMLACGWLFLRGVGIWGINIPMAGASRLSTSSGGSVSATRAR